MGLSSSALALPVSFPPTLHESIKVHQAWGAAGAARPSPGRASLVSSVVDGLEDLTVGQLACPEATPGFLQQVAALVRQEQSGIRRAGREVERWELPSPAQRVAATGNVPGGISQRQIALPALMVAKERQGLACFELHPSTPCPAALAQTCRLFASVMPRPSTDPVPVEGRPQATRDTAEERATLPTGDAPQSHFAATHRAVCRRRQPISAIELRVLTNLMAPSL